MELIDAITDALLDSLYELRYYILVMTFMPYILYYFWEYLKRVFTKLKYKNFYFKEKEKEYCKPITEEEKYLDISIMNEDIPVFEKRLKDLIEILSTKKDVIKIHAIEAIMIAEYFSQEVELSDNGILVVKIDTIKKFTSTIYNDPMTFTTYIKAIEEKLDIHNKKNKIPLKDALYIMRRAKEYTISKKNDDTSDDLLFNLKSQIHKSLYKDVEIRILDETKEVSVKNKKAIVVINTNPEFTDELSEEKNIEIEKQKKKKSNIESVERLEDGRLRIITKDNKEIIKDDFELYSIRDLNVKQQVTGSGTSQYDSFTDDTNQLDESFINQYIAKYGQLDNIEEENKTMQSFKFRLAKHFKINDFTDIKFSNNELENSLFTKENKVIFLTALFENYKKKNEIYVFVGEKKLKSKKIQKFLAVDKLFFISIFYKMVQEENKENFFNFIFNADHKVIDENLYKFLTKVNLELGNIFRFENKNLSVNAIYSYNNQTIKTDILMFDYDELSKKYFSDDMVKNSYDFLENDLMDKVKNTVFGNKALDTDATINLKYKTFFRIIAGEDYF